LAGSAAILKTSRSPARGWLSWRGPQQNGSSLEKKSAPPPLIRRTALGRGFSRQSTPVIANGRLYIMGYLGDGADLQRASTCFDAETGKQLWSQRYNDF